MIVVDTSVLVYSADADSPHHATCREWLEGQRRRADAWYTTWAILMREHGIRRILTRDTDFHRFPFLEVVDPLVAD